ncbi:MAG: hypothetical protein PHC69_03125, partial [Ruminiclostridium sp.]|nr:hypothetical protein [Ruminiclostridium sp.]
IHQAKIDSLKNEIDRIMHLITGFSEIYSNISGTILSISYNKNDKYSGLDAILTIKPVDAPLNLVLKTNKDIAELLNAGISFKINIYGDEMETEVLKNEPSGTKHLIYTSFSGNANDITELDRVTIEIDSMSRYCDCIIPNSAFYSPNSVFVLRETGGFWGKEYYVESCEVVAGEYNYRESQIIRGIERGDLIVTGWDRGLKNGQRVVLPLN